MRHSVRHNKTSKRFGAVLASAAMILSSVNAFGAIPRDFYMISTTQISSTSTREVSALDLTYMRQLSELAHQDMRMSVTDYIPTNMAPTNDESKVSREILTRSLGRWMEASDWGREHVREPLKAIEKPLSPNFTMTDEEGLNHQLNFKVDTTHALAQLQYRGYVDAQVNYQIAAQSLGVEVSRPMNLHKNARFVYQHTSNSADNRDLVGWQMSW